MGGGTVPKTGLRHSETVGYVVVLSQRMVHANVHFYVALVQPPSNTMVAANDGTAVLSAHRSAPYCGNPPPDTHQCPWCSRTAIDRQ